MPGRFLLRPAYETGETRDALGRGRYDLSRLRVKAAFSLTHLISLGADCRPAVPNGERPGVCSAFSPYGARGSGQRHPKAVAKVCAS